MYFVIISYKKRAKWIFPKGVVEKQSTEQDSAQKEAFEEAGILGRGATNLLTNYSYEKWGGTCHVKMNVCR
ncbi:MAG: NUDIX domain-containing protein [Bacteroidales bacterium]|nr:NUDIX domain-containing protein [Bacteroidales bacterium]